MKLFLILGAIFVLRIPSLFEPNWYGDEGIYLVVGQVIHKGGILYRDIWDNKTPLLYLIYAINPVLWFAKLAATISVLATCVGIYKITNKIASSLALLAMTMTGILLSIPLFEGTIANAELFFVLPIVWGALLIFNFQFSIFKLFFIGLLAGVAFLIKVPAVFDFIGMFIFLAIVIARNEMTKQSGERMTFIPIALGFFVLAFVVGLYFILNSAFGDFIAAAFSQNASYVAVSSGTFSTLTNPLFVKGLVLIVGSTALAVGFFNKIVSKELLFLGLWFEFSLFGALLSNRPYLHYLLQVVPPITILVVYLAKNFRKYWLILIAVVVILIPVCMQFKRAFRLPTMTYYRNFIDYEMGKKSWNEYVNSFDRNTLKTYEITEFVKNNTNEGDSIFVWDDAANIYVLSGRKPATKFIQAHHLTTVDKSNYDLIIKELKMKKPKLILIKDNSRFKFPKLLELVELSYKEVMVFENLHVFEKVL